jgi:pimeloyl-ACP methyl ester carboxylesterase
MRRLPMGNAIRLGSNRDGITDAGGRIGSVQLLIVTIMASMLLQAASQGENWPAYAEHQDLAYVLTGDGQKRPIKTTADWQQRRRHVLAAVQDVMGPLPSPTAAVPLDVKVLAETDLGHSLRRKIAYHTDSAEARVTAWLFLPKTAAAEKRPAMLCLHQTTPIGKDEPAGLGPNVDLDYALELAERGYVTLAPDYPSFGEHEHDFERDSYESGSMKAVYDNVRAIDLLETLPEVDGERIGCIGHSLGGHNAIFTAVFEPRIKAVVSSCGFTRFARYYNGDLTGWTSQRYMPRMASRYDSDPDRVPFDFTELVASLAPRAFLAVAPLDDDNFDVQGVREAVTAAKPIYRLHGAERNLVAEFPDAAHSFPPDARARAYEFLDRHLRGGKQEH